MSFTPAEPRGNVIDEIVRKDLLTAFIQMDAKLLSELPIECNAGSTATTLLRIGSRLFCANTGDSRTVLCCQSVVTSAQGSFAQLVSTALSEDHKPMRDDEKVKHRN